MEESLQTVIFFCRHGQTDRPYSSDPQIDAERMLTDEGRKQIQSAGEYVKAFEPAAIYCSPRKRTIETAEIIKKFGEIDGELELRDELLEIYTDAQYEDLAVTIPKLFQELISKHRGKHIVCASHQDVIEGCLRALGVSDEEAQFPCGVGHLYRIVYAGDQFVQAVKYTPYVKP